MGLREDKPQVVEVKEAQRVVVAAPRAGAIFGAVGFAFVGHQVKDGPYELTARDIFALSSMGHDGGAHATLFLDLSHRSSLRRFARFDVPFRQHPQPADLARLDEQVLALSIQDAGHDAARV